jgi:chaperone BCS1
MLSLSPSRLLNAFDGVVAAGGRLLLATTDHLERLDPALSRPGRIYLWAKFRHASAWRAELLFRNFFLNKAELATPRIEPVQLQSELAPIPAVVR